MSVECLCAGILVADHLCAPIPRLPKAGELILAERLVLNIGGCASNAGMDLAKVGVRVGLVGCVGRDFLGKFESECEPLDPSQCECRWSAQSERNVVEFALTWEEALEESILDRALRDPDDSFVRHLTSAAHVRVGFGILLSGDEAWTAISFGRQL